MNTESDPLDLESNNRNEDTTSSSSTKNLLEEYLPIDDHVELVSEGGQKFPVRVFICFQTYSHQPHCLQVFLPSYLL